MIGLAVYVVRKVARAWIVVWLQLASIVALYVVWPAGLIHGGGSEDASPLIWTAITLFVLGPFSNWIRILRNGH